MKPKYKPRRETLGACEIIITERAYQLPGNRFLYSVNHPESTRQAGHAGDFETAQRLAREHAEYLNASYEGRTVLTAFVRRLQGAGEACDPVTLTALECADLAEHLTNELHFVSS